MPPVVAALTSNFASKNANIFSTAEEALDELIKYIGISFTAVIAPYTRKLMFVPGTINVQVKLPYAQIMQVIPADYLPLVNICNAFCFISLLATFDLVG